MIYRQFYNILLVVSSFDRHKHNYMILPNATIIVSIVVYAMFLEIQNCVVAVAIMLWSLILH